MPAGRNQVQNTRLGSFALRVGVVVAYLLAAIICTWPLVSHLGNGVNAPIDPLDSIWRLTWAQERLLHAPWLLFEANTFYPYPRSYLFDELIIGPAILTLPLRLIIANPTAIYNLAVFSSFVLSGLGMYALARHLGCARLPAFAAGFIYAFMPLHMGHFGYGGHLGVLSGQYFPVVILLLDRLFAAPRWRDTIALAAVLILQALSSQYYAIYLLFVVGGFILLRLVQDGLRRRFPAWAIWRQLLVAGALAGLVVLPFGIGYHAVQAAYGFRRPLEEVTYYSTNVATIFATNDLNWFWGAINAPLRVHGGDNSERNLFPGAIGLVLAGLGALSAWRRPMTQYLLLLGVGSAILACGPELRLTADPASVLFDRMPYRYLYLYVPGFDSMRSPGRFGILFGLTVASLAGLGLHWLLCQVGAMRAGLARPGVVAMVLAVVIVGGIGLESLTRPYRVTPVVDLTDDARVPAVYRWLREQPEGVVLELPFLVSEKEVHTFAKNNHYKYFSLYHRHRLVNGSSDVVPKGYKALYYELKLGPAPRALAILQGLGVTYIVVHYDQLREESGVRIAELTRATLTTTPDVVREEASFGDDVVYRLLDTGQYARLRAAVPRDATVFISREDPHGAYGAMIARVLRDNRIYTRLRVEFGQEYAGLPEPGRRYDYAMLYRHENAARLGYAGGKVVWEDKVVRVYRHPDR